MGENRRVGRVSKDAWLAAALEELEKGGIESVRVERLAKILSVSKSGFYWHFKDRGDLHRKLLEYWFHEYTGVVTSSPLILQGDPKARLERVMIMIQQHDLAKYDLAIRAWAKHDDMAREVVQIVTKTRLDFIRAIFAEMGFEHDELEMRTRLFVSYHTWESAIFGDLSPRKRMRLRKRRLELLTEP
jgi:AcrR family transcriptional regulator